MLRFAAAPVALFAILAFDASDGGISGWDRKVVDYFDRHYYDFSALRQVAGALIYVGLIAGAAVAILLFIVLVARGLRRQAVFWGLAVAGPVLLTPVLKWLVGRPQIGAHPESDYSFPSGNAMVSVAFVAALFVLIPRFRRTAVVPAVVLSAAYGAALVLLLWHYPSDVVAAWSAALAWVAVVWILLGAPVVSDEAVSRLFPVERLVKYL